jgi:hypothetical protein
VSHDFPLISLCTISFHLDHARVTDTVSTLSEHQIEPTDLNWISLSAARNFGEEFPELQYTSPLQTLPPSSPRSSTLTGMTAVS